MADIKQAYNTWSKQYDSNENKTRDLEAKALRTVLLNINFETCLEIGCGTGKNTGWLLTKAKEITAVDFSEEMIAKAKEKIDSDRASFFLRDVTDKWNFMKENFDMITFSLVLEHIEDLTNIFKKASRALSPGGYIYIGELHPFKQYLGTKAKFETEKGLQTLTCFIHNISDFIKSAKQSGFKIENIEEHFDNDDKTNIPRILTMLFRKEDKEQENF